MAKQIPFGNDNQKGNGNGKNKGNSKNKGNRNGRFLGMTTKKATATVRHLARAFSPLRVRRSRVAGPSARSK